MIVLFVVIALGILMNVFSRKPGWGLGALIFLLPFERIGAFPLNLQTGYPLIRPSQVVGAALILAMAWRLVTKKEKCEIPKPIWWLLPLLVSLTYSAYRIGYSQLWRNVISAAFVFALCAVVAKLLPGNKRIAERSLFASAIVVCFFGLYQYIGDLAGLPTWLTGLRDAYTKAVFGYPRIQSTALEPLYFANYLLIPFFVGWATWAQTQSRRRLQVSLLITITLLLTMSRGAFIGALVGAVVLAVGLLVRRAKLPIKTLLIVPVLLIAITLGATSIASLITRNNAAQGPQTFISLLSSQLTKTSSFSVRLASQEQARKIFAENQIWGVGIAGFGPKVANYPAVRPTTWSIANNAFWELLAEMGLVGFVLFVAFLVHSWIRAVHSFLTNNLNLDDAWLLGLLAAVVAIFVQYQSFSGFFLTHIWVALGLMIGYSRRDAS